MSNMMDNVIDFSNAIGKRWTQDAMSRGIPEWLAKQEPNGRMEEDGTFTALSYDGLNKPFCNATIEEWQELYSIKYNSYETIRLAEEYGMDISTHYTVVKQERRRRFIEDHRPI